MDLAHRLHRRILKSKQATEVLSTPLKSDGFTGSGVRRSLDAGSLRVAWESRVPDVECIVDTAIDAAYDTVATGTTNRLASPS